MFDTGNTGFMLLATSLVMLMTPGLAFFYGGLVGRKNVRDSEQYNLFLNKYGEAVEEMEQPANLLRLLQTYESPSISMGDVLKWQKMNVHFTNPLHSPRHALTW